MGREEHAWIWVDGTHFNIRLEDYRLCTLLVLGVRANVLAVEDGHRESPRAGHTCRGELGRVD
jgi:hypothetical protein